MKTINNIILFLAVALGPLTANGQRTGSSGTPIVVGSVIAIVQSGANPASQKQEITRRIGKTVVEELGLQPSKIDSIQKMPYADLVAATQRALKKVGEQLTAEGYPKTGYGFCMSPTLDGVTFYK